MKMKLAAIAITFGLVGCNGVGVKPGGNTEVSTGNQTRLFVGNCMHPSFAQEDKAIGELIGLSLASSAVSKGFDALSNALKKAGEDKVNKTTLFKNMGHSGLEGVPKCIQVVRGVLRPAKEGDEKVFSDASGGYKYALDGEADLYAEVMLIPSKDNSAILFQPLKANYSGKIPGDKKTSKVPSLAISIGFATPESEINKGGFGVRLVNFEKGISGKSNDYYKEGVLDTSVQSQWLAYGIKGEAPYSLVVDVIETREGSKVAKVLSEMFEESKEDIEKAAKEKLAELEIFKTDKQIEEEKLKSKSDDIESESAYFTAVDEAETALKAHIDACSEDPVDPVKVKQASGKANIAQKKANLAAETIGKPAYYSDELIVEYSEACDG